MVQHQLSGFSKHLALLESCPQVRELRLLIPVQVLAVSFYIAAFDGWATDSTLLRLVPYEEIELKVLSGILQCGQLQKVRLIL